MLRLVLRPAARALLELRVRSSSSLPSPCHPPACTQQDLDEPGLAAWMVSARQLGQLVPITLTWGEHEFMKSLSLWPAEAGLGGGRSTEGTTVPAFQRYWRKNNELPFRRSLAQSLATVAENSPLLNRVSWTKPEREQFENSDHEAQRTRNVQNRAQSKVGSMERGGKALVFFSSPK